MLILVVGRLAYAKLFSIIYWAFAFSDFTTDVLPSLIDVLKIQYIQILIYANTICITTVTS